METPPAPSSPPAPRGSAAGRAVLSGLLVFGTMLLLAAGGGAGVWQLTGRADLSAWLAARLALVGAAAGVGAALVRLLGGACPERLLSRRLVPGDLGVLVGLIAGVFLAGYLAERQGASLFGRPSGLVVGQPVEIAGPTLAGGHFDLAEHRGKVVLVDFWANWCVPCVEEMANVRALYRTYHAEGLEVVGVSLDRERGELVKFLNARPTPWPHIFFDRANERGWHNPLARKYGVDAIPCLLVVGRDGKLAAVNVRGRQLRSAVARALGESAPDEGGPLGRLSDWALLGLLASAPWQMGACALGGAVLLGLAEVGVRRALRRRAHPEQPEPQDRQAASGPLTPGPSPTRGEGS